jgi:CheY-like chemotaxis protein
VIDDDPGFLQRAERQLGDAGYNVLLALTGRQARTLIESIPLDLALVDLVMPDENGLEIIRGFRQIAPDLRMIAITERASPQDLQAAEYLGATGTLVKPISKEWLAAIAQALRQSPRAASMQRDA